MKISPSVWQHCSEASPRGSAIHKYAWGHKGPHCSSSPPQIRVRLWGLSGQFLTNWYWLDGSEHIWWFWIDEDHIHIFAFVWMEGGSRSAGQRSQKIRTSVTYVWVTMITYIYLYSVTVSEAKRKPKEPQRSWLVFPSDYYYVFSEYDRVSQMFFFCFFYSLPLTFNHLLVKLKTTVRSFIAAGETKLIMYAFVSAAVLLLSLTILQNNNGSLKLWTQTKTSEWLPSTAVCNQWWSSATSPL